MITRLAIAAMVAATTLVTATGCAVERHQETVGAYVDDSAVTTKVKAKFAEDPTVSAMAIKVDTMKGVVQLSGFAKSTEERMMAERLARDTNGVQACATTSSSSKARGAADASRVRCRRKGKCPATRGIFFGGVAAGAGMRDASSPRRREGDDALPARPAGASQCCTRSGGA